MRLLHSATFGAALVMGAAGAQAADLISRQITNEPVETIVTQTPNGTVITRRPLAGPVAPVAPVVGAVAVEPRIAPAYEVGTVELQPAPAYPPPARYAPRHPVAAGGTYVDRPVGVGPPERTVVERRSEVRRTTTRNAHASQRVTHTRVTRTARHVAPPLVLDAAQRQVVYRTIVHEQVVPAATAYPAYPPPAYPQRSVVVPPAATTGYAVSTPVLDDDVYVEQLQAAAPAYAASYPIGRVLPANVVVTPLPATAAVAVPAVQPYSYATVDGRVLLVDPETNAVVADITP